MTNYLRRLYRTLLPLLYSRSQYRLFLKTAMGDLNLRMLALGSETDYFSSFVRAVPIRAPFGRSMVVVAPHQDDEAIGCGGALALQAASRGEAAVVILQDGATGGEDTGMPANAVTELRNEESRRAAATIGVDPVIFFNYPQLRESASAAAERLLTILRERKADAVFVPFVLDAHPDHRSANYILADALKTIPWDVRVFGYEVWGLCIPNVIVVIDDVMDKKIEMLSCFKFANSALDYVHSTKGLNMFHSRMLGAGECRYAERFFEVPKSEYIALVERIRAKES